MQNTLDHLIGLSSARSAPAFVSFPDASTSPKDIISLSSKLLIFFFSSFSNDCKFDKFFDNATHYFEKVTDRQLYTYKNILEYIDGEYVITNPISDANLQGMRENMDESDLEQFDKFVEKHWKKTAEKAGKTKEEPVIH